MLEVADLAQKKIDGWPAHMLATIAKNGKIRARRTEKLGSSEFPGRCCTSKCWLEFGHTAEHSLQNVVDLMD